MKAAEEKQQLFKDLKRNSVEFNWWNWAGREGDVCYTVCVCWGVGGEQGKPRPAHEEPSGGYGDIILRVLGSH